MSTVEIDGNTRVKLNCNIVLRRIETVKRNGNGVVGVNEPRVVYCWREDNLEGGGLNVSLPCLFENV